VLGCRLSGQNKDSGADDRPNAERSQLNGTQRTSQLAARRIGSKLLDTLAPE
jgi:hypothetical protein